MTPRQTAVIHRIRRRLPALAPLLCITLISPVAALASVAHSSSGGTGISGNPGAGTTTSTTTSGSGTTAPPASPVVNLGTTIEASGNGITVATTRSGFQGRTITFSGSVPVSDAGYTVVIQYTTSANPGHWVRATSATANSSGDFLASWTANVSGKLSFTAVLLAANSAAAGSTGGTTASQGQTSGLSTSTFTVTIFKSAIATFYGPGLWGHRTACGERLRKNTIGIASRTLKCGTDVTVYYRGREMTVPVIDRGPFANHATWDLTQATAQALGIVQTVTIGTLTQ